MFAYKKFLEQRLPRLFSEYERLIVCFSLNLQPEDMLIILGVSLICKRASSKACEKRAHAYGNFLFII